MIWFFLNWLYIELSHPYLFLPLGFCNFAALSSGSYNYNWKIGITGSKVYIFSGLFNYINIYLLGRLTISLLSWQKCIIIILENICLFDNKLLLAIIILVGLLFINNICKYYFIYGLVFFILLVCLHFFIGLMCVFMFHHCELPV